MAKKNEFGLNITQKISRTMTKAKLSEKFYNFLNERKKNLARELKLPENAIHTGCYYDRDTREYKGIIRIQKKCTDNQIDRIQTESKSIWTASDCEPYLISLYKNY